MKSQKKTQAEKIEIVKNYLATEMSYRETAEKYQVSYNNVYSWVKKYRKHRPDGLFDGRAGKNLTAFKQKKRSLKQRSLP
ncbi:hypothetical protein CL176_02770 [Suicoccus acidiformans]|uniref:Insertion element IS150 protein InsJ-like helix-turn-helix domain-containing protein n=1 Tax=Suicoccus acidiformans TaxID=2036206 RepID=A0A347WIX8_9LACT|nr:helix-turn-helix domain-containing protein [Suicoccus acidiformans]AXY25035.1 hypothetical protein CL176_02770 [Suicoccus acidiformans]